MRNGRSGRGSEASAENSCVTGPVTVVLCIPAAICKAGCFDVKTSLHSVCFYHSLMVHMLKRTN